MSAAQSPHLDTLLAKLRPFQRSAFEFAVYGTEDKSHSKSKANYNNYGAPKQVAGAGTGRILLGDEMGLGYVYYMLFICIMHLYNCKLQYVTIILLTSCALFL